MVKSMKKIFLVVIYKTLIPESKTCQFIKTMNLLGNKNNVVYIWDNSPDKINSIESMRDFFAFENICFTHTPQNISLAKIYNTVIDKFSHFDAIQIFDQDSYIRKVGYDRYLDSIFLEYDKINIFLPKIYSNNTIYSPGIFFIKGFHFRRIKDGINKNRFFTCITSGMMLKIKWIQEKKLVFNEELQLYCIDTDFICKYRKVDSSFFVMDIDFSHDLSEDMLTVEEKKNRRRVQLDGTKIIYKNNFFCKFLIGIYESLLKLTKRI